MNIYRIAFEATDPTSMTSFVELVNISMNNLLTKMSNDSVRPISMKLREFETNKYVIEVEFEEVKR